MQVKDVKYISGFKLEVIFANGKQKQIDFKPFLDNAVNPMTTKFRKEKNFKTVRVENGYLTWKNGDMEISGEGLYSGRI